MAIECPTCGLPRFYGPTGLAAPQCMCLGGYQKAATPAPAEPVCQSCGDPDAPWSAKRLDGTQDKFCGECRPGDAMKQAATPAPAPQPLTDAEIDMATDHLYCDGRPVPAKYRIALGRIVERLAGQGKEARK